MDAASFDTPEAEIAALRALLAERDAELRNAGFEIEKLKVQLAALRRDRYGKSSEKLAAEIGQLEMLIGDREEDQAQAAAAAEAKAKGQPGKPRRPALRRPLPEHLPRETVLHEPVLACRCGCTDPKRLTWQGPGAPAAFYRYSPDRKGERPRGHLEDFEGWLHADGYTGYDALAQPRGNRPPQVTHVACMAHVRRKLFEVFEATKSPIAEEALQRIAALYAIEAEINGKPATLRLTERQARSKPLLDDLHDWMLNQRRRLSGKSTLGKAMQYALNRWEALAHYLEDGRLSIDNNLAERQL